MATNNFYDFDITTGSSIQAGALFDIFDGLASIGSRTRSQAVDIARRPQSPMSVKSSNEGDP